MGGDSTNCGVSEAKAMRVLILKERWLSCTQIRTVTETTDINSSLESLLHNNDASSDLWIYVCDFNHGEVISALNDLGFDAKVIGVRTNADGSGVNAPRTPPSDSDDESVDELAPLHTLGRNSIAQTMSSFRKGRVHPGGSNPPNVPEGFIRPSPSS